MPSLFLPLINLYFPKFGFKTSSTQIFRREREASLKPVSQTLVWGVRAAPPQTGKTIKFIFLHIDILWKTTYFTLKSALMFNLSCLSERETPFIHHFFFFGVSHFTLPSPLLIFPLLASSPFILVSSPLDGSTALSDIFTSTARNNFSFYMKDYFSNWPYCPPLLYHHHIITP